MADNPVNNNNSNVISDGISAVGEVIKPYTRNSAFENIFQSEGAGEEMSKLLSSGSVDRSGVKLMFFPRDLFQDVGGSTAKTVSAGNQSRVEIDILEDSNNVSVKASIALYLPPDISTNYQANWQENPLGGIAGAGRELATTARQAESIYKNSNSMGAFAAAMGQAISSKIANAGGGAGSGTAMSRQTVNPHKALLYEGHKFREFSINFDLFARSKAESDDIKEIIKVLKRASHPGNAGSTTFSFPDSFMVRFMTANLKEKSNSTQDDAGYMFVFGPCILANIDVKYGPNQAAFFVDTGAPVHVQLTLQFQEIFQLTKEHIDNGW